jgi:hypothetical protein
VKFSVVIPCYNQGPFLHECLESVRHQRLPAAEVIVVDDGSTDPFTIARIDELCVPPIKLVRQPNRGLSAARNAGVDAATGDWILPLDADDQITPDALERYAEAIAGDPSIDIWYPDIAQFGLDQETLHQPEFDPWRLLWNNHLVCSSAIRRSVFTSGIRYNEKMRQGYEDWEFYIHACCERDFRASRLRRAVFRYRRWGYSMIAASDDRRTEVIAQLQRGRPVFRDEPRLDALKREHSPFFAVAVNAPATVSAIEQQTFRDVQVVDRAGVTQRTGELDLFADTPGANLLISFDDRALVAALCGDRALLEKVALSLRARPPGLSWLVESAGAVPGSVVGDGRRVGVIVPLQLFLLRPLLRRTGHGLAGDLTDHARALHVPLRALALGGDGRPVAPTEPPVPRTTAELFRDGVISAGRTVSARAREVMGPERHDRLWQLGLLKLIARRIDRASMPDAQPLGDGDLRPGPIPVERDAATDARLRLIAADAPRFPISSLPSLLLAVPRLDGENAQTVLALVAALRARASSLRLLAVVTHSADVTDAKAILPHLDGLFALPELSAGEPGPAFADLVRRHAVRGLLIEGAREAFVALPSLAREPVRPAVFARIDQAGPGSLGEEMAARFNNLIDAYLVPSAETSSALAQRCYVSPAKLWPGSFAEQLDRMLAKVTPPDLDVRPATRQLGESR